MDEVGAGGRGGGGSRKERREEQRWKTGKEEGGRKENM